MKNVLIVDDTKANRIFITECFHGEGYEAKAVGSGKEAMKLLLKETYRFVVLDVKMPFISGTQLLKWIKENNIDTKVIMITAYATVKNALECINNGAIDYIQKPFTTNRFKKFIGDIEKKIKGEYIFGSSAGQRIVDNTLDFSIDTEYAAAERMPDDVISRQAEEIIKQNTVTNLFEMIPYSILILNSQRQIVYSNYHFFKFIGINLEEQVHGLRPGEILKCVHSKERSTGCGTTEHCSVCGAVDAILESQDTRMPVSRECLMTLEKNDTMSSMELLIYAAPAGMIDEDYTILVVKDISQEKRRQAVEKIFFHDILNSSWAVKGLINCVEKSLSKEHKSREIIDHASEAADIMIDEIKTQMDLMYAEKGELKLNSSTFPLKAIISRFIRHYESIFDCKVDLRCEEEFTVKTDKVLLLRVINNMLKNALEASENEMIKVTIKEVKNFIEISVDNKKYIPRKVQLQIFKRHFSTKGEGRGLGTYSMKLIGEFYLKGYIKFTSDEEKGTTFIFGLPYDSMNNN
ncbi:response regulator [Clostridium pasteurianum DSM 525 = ATCC 6013]|uniref:Stage 0 sporulation protein A homolog n=2 Tax=Clostridium pasteurianum TaxID=1501 RepID=A0A0H3J7C5_CLOPA|nr:hybrid sensor histidine kinase/response regulator [Clostridium pasteurianum]AJA46880.1 response regulator [Clostridium pasteurianum DSM 525 = ATCC 6013]AJA50868.1 response regulator [Clostridium pasteurianum DSM 525 = ATCC 6013]AOZ74264.1 histidine kinase [Clostridium pasteurianum DSM 525 = ATCC 6013]AOZ78063.1 histidine kinase [Clostridium pasteurianum]ELP58129.1 histidine kinase [Clostridium pasteurianum DSM 525 = ATCC 6013]